MILRRPPAADCSGGKAEDAWTRTCRTGIRTNGRGDLRKRAFKLNVPQNENSPQLEGIGDSGGIVVDDGETSGQYSLVAVKRSVCSYR